MHANCLDAMSIHGEASVLSLQTGKQVGGGGGGGSFVVSGSLGKTMLMHTSYVNTQIQYFADAILISRIPCSDKKLYCAMEVRRLSL